MRTTLYAAIIVSCICGLGCQVVIADDCSYTAHREATIDGSGAERLVISVGAGSLDVKGDQGMSQVSASGTACASDEDYLDQIRLTTDRRGSTLYLKAEYPTHVRGNAALDLVVEVPASLAVEIEDGSGSITVRSVAALEIDDGSGSIDVGDVRGDVEIDDGSGEIEVLGVGGRVVVDDGSGALKVTGVGGSVRVSDGSGEIVLRDIDGEVLIEEDGSGGIEISGVGASVVIDEDGSGSISVRDVEGDFTLRRDGSGSVSVDDVRGSVSIPD